MTNAMYNLIIKLAKRIGGPAWERANTELSGAFIDKATDMIDECEVPEDLWAEYVAATLSGDET